MQPIYAALAFAAGAVLPLQALINARLGARLGGPLWAATVSFAVGTLALLFFQLLTRAPAPALAAALRALGHFGVLAAAAQPVTLAKAIGGLLLLGGVILVTRG